MTNKQIETSREIRLWIGQIIVPAVTTVAMTMAVPEIRHAVVAKAKIVTAKIKGKIKKSKKNEL